MIDQTRWCNHAFGLAIDSSFAIAGFPSVAPPAAKQLPGVVLSLADTEALSQAFADDTEVIAWHRDGAGEPTGPDVLSHPEAGFLLSDQRMGLFQVTGGGEQIRCAPREEVPWRWQRYLLGRVLPFAATLRGLEPWHAAAVRLGTEAVSLMGESGTGKTTIAAALILGGAELVADDVISVRIGGQNPLVHPGPPLVSVRTDPRPPFAGDELQALGTPVGRDARALRIAVRRADDPLPLRALYLLKPDPSPTLRLEEVSAPDRLLAGTFNSALRTPARLSRQLEVAAAISRHTDLVRVAIPPAFDLRAVAEKIHRDAHNRTASSVGGD